MSIRSQRRKAIKMTTTVLQSIESERVYQEWRWPGHEHSVAEWLLIMQKCLDDAKREWVTAHSNDVKALDEIRQVVATGVACMEQFGCNNRYTPNIPSPTV